jgi:hypothetical protein
MAKWRGEFSKASRGYVIVEADTYDEAMDKAQCGDVIDEYEAKEQYDIENLYEEE